MSGPSRHPETRPEPPVDTHRDDPPPDGESSTRTPRWVKRSGLAAIALALLFAIVHLAGGGLHGHLAPAHHERPQP